ncbi:armadillo-type protein [Geopyxis carbonaria]|nr:armadillo-type protein [Geopyxis carbonaria]
MDQLEKAVEIALSPHLAQELQQQAINYVQGVRDSENGWQACLPLFTRMPPASETVRVVCLDILAASIDKRLRYTADESTQYIKQTIQEYVQATYTTGSGVSDSAAIQNKLSQILTKLFLATYTTSWQSFFDDLMALGKSSPNSSWDNPEGILLFIRTCVSVHDEVADTLIPRTPEEGARNINIKDCIRDRDMNKLVTAWQQILTEWNGKQGPVVEMCLHVIARWVSWIDISLVVNDVMMRLLFQFMGSDGSVRDAALVALTEIVGKKMKGPDKLDLITFLNVGEIIGQIAQSPSLQNQESMDYDTDLAEGAAKLANTAALDIVLILSKGEVDEHNRQRAEALLQSFMPLLLRFFSDQYDEVSSAVFAVTQELLSLLRKEKKATGTLHPDHASLLLPILNAIVMKTKYDSETTWGDEDEQTDEAEFEQLKQKLKTMQDAVASIDEDLYVRFMSQLVEGTFERVNGGGVDWRELDLALHELHLFGEIAMKYGGIFSKGGKPSGPPAEILISMLGKMMACNVSDYAHPATKLKSMEIFMRYTSFFEVHSNLIPQALESFNKCIHDSHIRVRTRSWYLFLRFVKNLRQHMGEIAETILGAIGDLLVIRAELPNDTNDVDELSSQSGGSEDATFESQLSLFEAVGFLCSSPSLPVENQALMVKSAMAPLFSDIEAHLGPAENGDALAALQIHHDIMALGTLGRGFSNWTGGMKVEVTTGELVADEFVRAMEAVLVALERLSKFLVIRESARLAFSKMVGVLGPKILTFLPRWISGLLAKSSSRGEISMFLKLLEQIVHGFKNVVYNILNELLSPLLQRVFSSLSGSTTGTDDELELADLRREFLSFLLVIINNDLGQVFVSETNLEQFQSLLEAISHYARNISDPATQKIALNTLNKLSFVFGPSSAAANEKAKMVGLLAINAPQEQPLAGFENLMKDRFAILCWEIPATPGFNVKDAQSKQVLGEVANFQKMLYLKLGDEYLQTLRNNIFPQVGVNRGVDEYCSALQNQENKEFRKFFQRFVQEVLRSR